MTFTETAPRHKLVETAARTAFLIVDTESVPDGRLLASVKFPGENLTPDEAIVRAQTEARESSKSNSDFLPVSFQVPVAICAVRVGADFRLQAFTCLDHPQFRPREIVKDFWTGYSHYAQNKAKLVTFNGRGFDMPLLELAAFRFGISARHHYLARDRFRGNVIDLYDWLNNFGACWHTGGMNLLAKLIGKPGKMGTSGDQVYSLFRAGKLQEINDYCLCDTLDTYFIFLRTRVLTGDISLKEEEALITQARELLDAKVVDHPVLRQYLDSWSAPEPM